MSIIAPKASDFPLKMSHGTSPLAFFPSDGSPFPLPTNDYTLEEDKVDIQETINVDVKLPPALKNRAFKNESSVNLLQVATVIYNNELEVKPENGIGKLIFFLKDEKFEYDFRIHEIWFKPTLDLDNTYVTARLSSSDNKMVQRLVNDHVAQFCLSGKLTQRDSGEVDTIVITKIIAHVDQTAYAKRHEKHRKEMKRVSGLPDLIEEAGGTKRLIDEPPSKGVKEAWEDFQKKSQPTDTKLKTRFDYWREAFKKLSKKVDT